MGKIVTLLKINFVILVSIASFHCTDLSNVLALIESDILNYWRWGLALGNAKIYQHVGIIWRYLTLKFVLPPTPNLKFALPPTPTPDASQWNIGGIGSSGVGHIYFMYISC